VNPLLYSAQYGHLSIVDFLINHGFNVNEQGYQNQTPHHIAIIYRHHKIAEYLVNHGSDINRMDISNETPLIKALHEGHASVIEFLVKNGANIHMKDLNDIFLLLIPQLFIILPKMVISNLLNTF